MNQDGRHSPEAGVLGQHHVDNNAGCHPGVGGVAALLQDTVTRRRRQVMSRGDHMGVTGYQGPKGSNTLSHRTPSFIRLTGAGRYDKSAPKTCQRG